MGPEVRAEGAADNPKGRPTASQAVVGLVTLSFGVATACGSSSSSSSPPAGDDAADAGGGGDDAGADAAVPYPAPHPAMPQAITLGGPVMKAPKIVAISFQGDPLVAQLDTFVTQLVAATSYWSGTTAEYGVGPLTATQPVHLAETAASPLTDAQVQQCLTAKINGGAGFPQPDANTHYVIFYPAGVNVTSRGGALCQAFQGYHASYALSATSSVVYSVIGRCPPPVAGLADIDEVSAEASHEIMEAATDPYPSSSPAWAAVAEEDSAWALVGGGGELGDLCAPFPGVFYRPTGIDNLVQRTWSNAAAAAGHDPCQPNGPTPYFNSAPVMPDMIDVVGSPIGTFKAKGVQIPIGKDKTIELDLYSDAPTSGPWTVTALDLSSMFFRGAPALSFTFDKTQGRNGDKLHLTIKALAGGAVGASPFWIQNQLGDVTTIWTGLVGN
jgi:hypothetical protein